MKLRNKKTGEIREIKEILIDDMFTIHFLAKLNEEWEDYQEPKKHYEILAMGTVMEREDVKDEIFRNQGQREIGNYFETKEEAEKAVEKLKAWKRLKDKGFRFERWLLGGEYGNTITFSDYIECDDRIRADLDLLFGGEE